MLICSEPAGSADDHGQAGQRVQPADGDQAHSEKTLALPDLGDLPPQSGRHPAEEEIRVAEVVEKLAPGMDIRPGIPRVASEPELSLSRFVRRKTARLSWKGRSPAPRPCGRR